MDLANLAGTIGPSGALILVVLLILRGRLVPRSTLEDLRKDKDRQIDTWQTAYERSEQAREIMRDQITELLEMAKTTTHVIESLPSVASGRRPHVVPPTEDRPGQT